MKILVAEDDPVTRLLLKTSLEKWQYDVTLTSDGVQARDVLLGKEAPKLAILDWMMPGIDGVDVCRELRKRDAGSYIYVLLLTSKSTKRDLLTGLESGADDYLIKPFDLLELQARLWSGQRIITLQDQLIAARETLREQATHDALTGVWNRVAILDILRREINRTGREGNPLSVIMVDVDRFKQINDTWGHQMGDRVLCEVTRRMRSVMRSYDSLGRYGGEEFLVIAPGCAGAVALKLAEKLRAIIDDSPVATSGAVVPVTLSLGVACYSDGLDADSILKPADEALYCAKRAGRNRCELART
jgi:two-component system cell cycle response regulator